MFFFLEGTNPHDGLRVCAWWQEDIFGTSKNGRISARIVHLPELALFLYKVKTPNDFMSLKCKDELFSLLKQAHTSDKRLICYL